MENKIENIIVLMLENRSFDHMLGFLQHPNPNFKGLKGTESNLWEPGRPPVKVDNKAQYSLPVDPGHSHSSVMFQLLGKSDLKPPYNVNNSGFVGDYERKVHEETKKTGLGKLIMQCQSPDKVEVLATLAREFCVCDRWFCSVPGETWPNRNFVHAATSDGEVNIRLKPYFNRTIYQLLSDAKRDWRIYHDGLAQAMAFPKIWYKGWRKRFKGMNSFFKAVRKNKLPHYSFIEPDHFGKDSNSQHPGNNSLSKKQPGRDFLQAERLVAEIYQALKSNPKVWHKSLFVITYDEHGGFYDHEAPPVDSNYSVDKIYKKNGYEFKFDLLGPRVPAVLVSPFIPKGVIDSNIYDHASVVRTVREVFAPGLGSLTSNSRDKFSSSFHHNLSLTNPRSDADVPDFSRLLTSSHFQVQSVNTFSISEFASDPIDMNELDDFQSSLIWLGRHVEDLIAKENVNEIDATNEFMWWDETRILSAPTLKTTDDLTSYQKHVVKMFRKSTSNILTLRGPSGDSIDAPSDKEWADAITEVARARDKESEIWVEDSQGHILSVTKSMNAEFYDAELDTTHEISKATKKQLKLWFELLTKGHINQLREAVLIK